MWKTNRDDSRLEREPEPEIGIGRRVRAVVPGFAAAALGLITVAALGSLGGCQSTKEAYADTFLAGRTITYDEYLELNTQGTVPVSVDDVIARLGKPASVHDRDGARRRLDYHAFSMTGELKRAEFHFDREERLTKKAMW